MDGLGSAASVIAVIDLTAKVASLCFHYSKAVKSAKSDIERLRGELERLSTALEGARQLLEGPNSARLQTSQRLRDGLHGCSSQLTGLQTGLETRLGTGTGRRIMTKFGVRALKWPFESKDVDGTVVALGRYREALSAALTIDIATQVLDTNQTLVLSKLPIAKDAAFDSHADEHDARCHPETRVALRQEIMRWAEDPQGECIFWLNGMAGTGKSTISRTVAQSFAEKGDLGASFFFKRGERDRGNAARLFTTIAADLAAREPALAAYIQAAIDANPVVTGKALKEQFEKLILQPLGNLECVPDKMKGIALVIDALDECERDDDIRAIIYLLSQAKTLTSVRLRAFVTSRPELPIRLGFNNIKGKYQDLVLHEIPKPIIEHDISAFLDHKLTRVREDYNALSHGERRLPLDWPGSDAVQDLAQMAVPLFIFAATVCRFIEDPAWSDPARQLTKVLEYQSRTRKSEIDKLDATYRPILDQLLTGTEAAKRLLANEFRTVVGSIILLAEPLSISSLARLLHIDKSVIDRRLVSLHSVLSVPASAETPVRMFHLSFRDFLVDPDKRGTNPFWVDERTTHKRIASRCLELLSGSGHLRKDICNLAMSGVARTDVDPAVIESSLPADVRYACLYWVHHMVQSSARITDSHQAYLFLKRHLLHWFEALGLLGKISDSITMIKGLQAFISPGTGSGISAFLQDANRFVLSYHSIIDLYPAQVYSSAIVFAPKSSIIRNIFEDCIPRWISLLPKVDPEWNACLQILEGHDRAVRTVAFSPDGATLASASGDRTVRLWDTKTGKERQKLEGHGNGVWAVAFSPDGATLASASDDQTIRLWDARTGEEKQRLEGHGGLVIAIAFSPADTTLASALDDGTVRLWDVKTGEKKQRLKLEGHGILVTDVAFSPDSTTLAWVSAMGTSWLWDAKTGEEKQRRICYSSVVRAVAFSPNGTTLASALDDGTVWLCDAKTGKEKQRLKGHGSLARAIAFSPDSTTLASASEDQTFRVWDSKIGKVIGHRNGVTAVAFSPDGTMLASASSDGTVRLWDAKTGENQRLEGHNDRVNAIVSSSDGTTLASASNDRTIRLWDAKTGEEKQRLEGRRNSVTAIAFSPADTTLASALDDGTVRLWDVKTGEEKQRLEGHDDRVNAIVFSPDGTTLASASDDRTVQLWDAKTGEEKQRIEGHHSWVRAVAFSPDGTTLASTSDDGTVRLWDAKTGEEKQRLEGHNDRVNAIAFSPDGTTLASASYDGTVRLWDAKTGEEKQTLRVNQILRSLSFSTDNRYLKTDRGKLSLYLDSTEMSLRNDLRTMQCFLDNAWVVRDGRKVLWLPPGIRTWCSAFYDNAFALGYDSGLVKFIQFTFT